MDETPAKPTWSLPYSTPVPADPERRPRVKAARTAGYILLAVALVVPVVQFQVGTMRRYSQPAAVRQHKGALWRWRAAIHEFWDGKNIYRNHLEEAPDAGSVRLHPNMPFTVVLLTPFAYLPIPVMALAFNMAKLLAVCASILMAARLAGHKGRRICDWVVGLGLLWTVQLVISDIQHGNTNVFVLFAIVLHLWLFRRGRDLASGAALALAICLKMTPALFVLYWLYQRSWKLLAGVVSTMLLFAVVIPGAAIGPERYAVVTGTWLKNLIAPPLVKGSWFPHHMNQALPGVAARYLLGKPDPNGDIFWCPDDPDYASKDNSGWIAPAALSEASAKALIRLGQVLILGLTAWVIGWRKLPRDDGRRALHYGLVLLAMLMVNQRSWDHYAGILLPGAVAVWQAIAFGRMKRHVRAVAISLALAAGLLVWLGSSGTFVLIAKLAGRGKEKLVGEVTTLGVNMTLAKPIAVGNLWGDIAKAYGTTFFYFALLFAAAVVLGAALKKAESPYARERQKLFG